MTGLLCLPAELVTKICDGEPLTLVRLASVCRALNAAIGTDILVSINLRTRFAG